MSFREETDVWPPGFDPEIGFSDEQLSQICSDAHGQQEGSGSLVSPWLYFSSELYSHGRCIREWVGWPRGLPIAVFSDHGVHHYPNLWGPDCTNSARVHLTWSAWRDQNPDSLRKRVIRIMHPWIGFRRRHGIEPRQDRRGTLVFIPHGLPGHRRPDYDWDTYFQSIKEVFGAELTLMVMMHDVIGGFHKRLRQFGLPIVTAGNTSSPLFVERFYNIVGRFETATSYEIGTHTYMCHEFGINSVLLGDLHLASRSILDELPPGMEYDPSLSSARAAFRHELEAGSEARDTVTDQALGISLGEDHNRKLVRREMVNWLLPAVLSTAPRAAKKLRELILAGD